MTRDKLIEKIVAIENEMEKELKASGVSNKYLILQGKREALSELLAERIMNI